VLYATGSAVIVDVEESLRRAGIVLAAGIRNHPGTCYLGDPQLSVAFNDLDGALVHLPYLVPLFTPANRRTAVEEARDRGFVNALTLIDPTAVTPSSLALAEGSYLAAATSIGAMSTLGRHAFVNRGASIGHHFSGGDFVSIGPGAVIAGQVTVGHGSMVGAGAVIVPSITIGRGCLVAAGSVVTSNVPDGCIVRGNPARLVRSDLPTWDSASS
jgi:sugar O-acyltransferase (sialic acid O-acetyltransferase NeuD family)